MGRLVIWPSLSNHASGRPLASGSAAPPPATSMAAQTGWAKPVPGRSAAVPSRNSTTIRTPRANAGRSRAKGAACRPKHSVRSSGRPMRAATSENVEGPGRAVHFPGSRCRAMLRPAPNQNGSFDASATTRHPRSDISRAIPSAKGTGHAICCAFRSGSNRRCRGRAGHDFGGLQRGQACARQTIRRNFAQSNDGQPRSLSHDSKPSGSGRHDRGDGAVPRAPFASRCRSALAGLAAWPG